MSTISTIAQATAITILIWLPFGTGACQPALAQKLPSKNIKAISGFRVVDVFGKVEWRTRSGSYTAVARGAVVDSTTLLRTGDDSAVLMVLPDSSFLRVGAKSVVQFSQSPPTNPRVTYSCKLLSGQAWAIVPGKSQSEFELNTPSASARTRNGLFGVGYDLEADQSFVSVEKGSVAVSLASGGWKGTATAGQYVHYLRRPQPNIRLRAPEIARQAAEQQEMWKLLRAENWTNSNQPAASAKLNRGNEAKLRGMSQTVQVVGGGR